MNNILKTIKPEKPLAKKTRHTIKPKFIMKKSFIKLGLLTLTILLSLTHFSCKKDKETESKDFNSVSEIVASNVINSIPEIHSIRFRLFNEEVGDNDFISEASYINSGFILDLPKTLSDKYLIPFEEPYKDCPDLTISDISAKSMGFMELFAYDKEGEFLGYLKYSNSDDYNNLENFASWIYVDKDVKINGKLTITNIYEEYEMTSISINHINYNLKKGWNWIYGQLESLIDDETNTYTSTYRMSNKKPDNIKFKWYFYDKTNE